MCKMGILYHLKSDCIIENISLITICCMKLKILDLFRQNKTMKNVEHCIKIFISESKTLRPSKEIVLLEVFPHSVPTLLSKRIGLQHDTSIHKKF